MVLTQGVRFGGRRAPIRAAAKLRRGIKRTKPSGLVTKDFSKDGGLVVLFLLGDRRCRLDRPAASAPQVAEDHQADPDDRKS